jgi:hypothetical protein
MRFQISLDLIDSERKSGVVVFTPTGFMQRNCSTADGGRTE